MTDHNAQFAVAYVKATDQARETSKLLEQAFAGYRDAVIKELTVEIQGLVQQAQDYTEERFAHIMGMMLRTAFRNVLSRHEDKVRVTG